LNEPSKKHLIDRSEEAAGLSRVVRTLHSVTLRLGSTVHIFIILGVYLVRISIIFSSFTFLPSCYRFSLSAKQLLDMTD